MNQNKIYLLLTKDIFTYIVILEITYDSKRGRYYGNIGI